MPPSPNANTTPDHPILHYHRHHHHHYQSNRHISCAHASVCLGAERYSRPRLFAQHAAYDHNTSPMSSDYVIGNQPGYLFTPPISTAYNPTSRNKKLGGTHANNHKGQGTRNDQDGNDGQAPEIERILGGRLVEFYPVLRQSSASLGFGGERLGEAFEVRARE